LGQKVIAIGASAGGLNALHDLLGEIPNDFAAPIVVAIHSLPFSRQVKVLNYNANAGQRICEAEDGTELENGVIYVIPGATHGLFSQGKLRLSKVVRDSGFRPSIDALFMTLAAEYRENAIAVVLSGALNDGMRGAQVIYDLGGQTIVQDPREADFAAMPRNVIRADHPTEVLLAQELGIWLREAIEAET
jgi:chemotaxis response regulator CheB